MSWIHTKYLHTLTEWFVYFVFDTDMLLFIFRPLDLTIIYI